MADNCVETIAIGQSKIEYSKSLYFFKEKLVIANGGQAKQIVGMITIMCDKKPIIEQNCFNLCCHYLTKPEKVNKTGLITKMDWRFLCLITHLVSSFV